MTNVESVELESNQSNVEPIGDCGVDVSYLNHNGMPVSVEEMVLSSSLFLERLRKEVGWIDIKIETPDEYEKVLVFDSEIGESHQMYVAYISDGEWILPWGNDQISTAGDGDITYWMPLPESPKGE